MKYQGIYWTVLSPMIKSSIRRRFGEELAERAVRHGKPEYRRLVDGAPELGRGNNMASNAYFAYVFVAAWLGTGKELRPSDMAIVMRDVLARMRPFFALTDLNKTPKKWHESMARYAAWYDAGNGERYPTTWKVHFDENLHRDGDYYYFTACPICSYLTSIGLGEIMPSLCETDSTMFAFQHGVLHRDHTIASGDDVCDYWIVGDQVADPQ